jgi:hypothetical protein
MPYSNKGNCHTEKENKTELFHMKGVVGKFRASSRDNGDDQA